LTENKLNSKKIIVNNVIRIAGSAAKLEILEARVDSLDDLKKPFHKLEELSAKLRAELGQLTKSVDVNHQKFVAGMHDNHVSSSASKCNFNLILRRWTTN
jgi:hypothetical protein